MLNTLNKYVRLRLNPMIRSLPAVKYIHLRQLNKRINISSNPDFVHYRIPKAANSTIMRSIANYDKNIDISKKNNIADVKKKSYYNHPLNLGLKKSSHVLSDYFVFTFVRNPYDRVLSAYLDKIVHSNSKNHFITKRLNKKCYDEVSFNEFVDYLAKGGVNDNIHWSVQSSILPPQQYLDYVGHVENLDDHLSEIIAFLFPDIYSFNVVYDLSHATKSREKYLEYYTPFLMNKVYEIYKEDFERFGYDKRDVYL